MTAPGSDDDPNLASLTLIANALGELCQSPVFVGGCSTGLLVTSVRAQPIRVTRDVDLVAEVASVHEYHAMEARLRAKGFAHDHSPGAPICRWVKGGVAVDVMPSASGVLGFHNGHRSRRTHRRDSRGARRESVYPPAPISLRKSAMYCSLVCRCPQASRRRPSGSKRKVRAVWSML